jgi:PAS domain S-box-containing protein
MVDFLEAASRLLNHRIHLHIEDPWGKVQERAENREIDGLSLGARSPRRAVHFRGTDTILDTYYSIFARSKNEHQIRQLSDLDGMRIGYREGGVARDFLRELPSAELKTYGTNEALTKALLSKEVDVVLAWLSYDFFRKNILQGTIDNILLIEEYPMEMVTHIRKDWPEFVSIMNKVITAMQQDELPRILNKWFIDWPQSYSEKKVLLTLEEQAWLDTHPVLRIGLAKDSLPLSTFDRNGKPIGIVADYFQELKDAIGLDYEFLSMTFPEVLTAAQERKIDLFTGFATPERKEYALFSDSLFTIPYVIIAKQETPFIQGIESLSGKKAAIIRNIALRRHFAKTELKIEFVLVDSVSEGLKAVSEGDVYAYLGDALTAGHMINQEKIMNLKVAAPLNVSKDDIRFAVRSDWPEIQSILNKFIASIPPQKHYEIYNNWMTIRFERPFDYTLLWKVLAGISSVVIGILFWNKQLSRKVTQRTSQLMESESRFRATFEQAAVGVAHVSLEGKFLRLNRKFCDIVGYSEDEMHDLTFQDITHPDDSEKDLLHARQLLDGGRESYSAEKRYCRKDSSVVWVNLTVSMVFDKGGAPQYFVSVMKDISDRKQAEEKLRQSLEFQQHLTSSAPDAVLSIKMPERTIEWANDSYGVLGYETEELVGKRTENFYADPKEYRKVSDLLDEAIRNGKDIVRFEALLRRKNGEAFHADISTSVYREDGAVTSLTAMVRDITERKQAEYALRESEREKVTLREELIHATRRMAMGELTTAIAHELNQPLAAIMVNAQTAMDSMKGGTLPTEEMEEILEDIIRDDRRAGDIIGKLRGLLKGGRKDFAPIRINEVVEEVLSLVRSDMLIRKIVMEKMLAEDIPPINGDRIQLQQVFLNLILNAADALVEVEKEPRKITVMTQYKDNKEVWISISDTGPGLDDAVKDRLFDPFYTTKSEGMGVGLAICSTIVKLHGGGIQTESRRGGGATFHVVLPNAQEEESPCPD